MKSNRWAYAGLTLLGLVALVLFLDNRFPGALSSQNAQIRLTYGMVLIVAILGSAILGYRGNPGLAVKQALTWIAITLMLVVSYSYRHELGALMQRTQSALVPSAPVQTEPGVAYLSRGLNGHFNADAMVNGTHVHFLVDTGATDVALTREDARRAGIDLNRLSYTTAYDTANGRIMAARMRLDEVSIGDIVLRDVDASVMRSDTLPGSLLGMSFLGRLRSVEVSGDRLILRE